MFKSYMISLNNYSNKYTFINYLENQNIIYKILNSIQMFLVNASKFQIQNISKLEYIAIIAEDESVSIELGATNNKSKIKEVNKQASIRKLKFDPDESEILNWGIEEMNANCLWNRDVTGKGIKVAVIDSGVGPRQGIKVKESVTFIKGTSNDINGHGTSVASIINGLEDFGFETGIYGVAYDCELYSLKIVQGEELENDEKIIFPMIEAINWCIENKINIANMSIGVKKQFISNKLYQLLNEAIQKAIKAGIVIVCASGNTGKEIDEVPALIDGVMVIGSINKQDQRSPFSSFGSKLDFIAPGEQVETMSINNSIKTVNGTSFSTPQVTGLIALILSQNPLLTPKEVRDILIRYVRDIQPPGYDIYTGYGTVKAPIGQTKRSVSTNQIIYQIGQSGNIEFKAQDDDRAVAYLDVEVAISFPDNTLMNHKLRTNKDGVVNIEFATDKNDLQNGQILLNKIGEYNIRGIFIGTCCNCTGSKQPSTNINVISNTLSACIKKIYRTCNFRGYYIEVEVTNRQNSPVENVTAELIGISCEGVRKLQTETTNKKGIVTLCISDWVYFSYKTLCIKFTKEGYKEFTVKCIYYQ